VPSNVYFPDESHCAEAAELLFWYQTVRDCRRMRRRARDRGLNMKRRTLLTLACRRTPHAHARMGREDRKAHRPLKILILGGTRSSDCMTALALARGHTLTFFSRGKTRRIGIRKSAYQGDRNGEIDGLKGREWTWSSTIGSCRDTCGSRQIAGAKEAVRFRFVDLGLSDFSVPRDERSRWANSATKPSRKWTATPTGR
jgi:hypothetical protein